MKVEWSPQAVADVQSIDAYVSADNPWAAQSLLSTIFDLVEQRLPQYPNIGRPGRVRGTRELVVGGTPYIVPYRVSGDRIEILGVYHAARRWPDGF